MEDLAKYPGLVRRSGSQNWYFKARVPTDLVALCDGKTQIWRSLGTADRSEAERVWYGVSAAIRDEFDSKREMLSEPLRAGVRRQSRTERIRQARLDAMNAGEPRKALTHLAATELARTWYAERLATQSLADPADVDEVVADLSLERTILLDANHPDTLRSVQQAADVLLERFGFAGVPGGPSYEHLAGALRMAMLEMNRHQLEQLDEGPDDSVRAMLFRQLLPIGNAGVHGWPAGQSPAMRHTTVGEASRRFWEDELPNRSRTERDEIKKVQGWLDLIVDVFGPDNGIEAVNAESCTKFLRLLQRYPARRGPKYSKLPPEHIADLAASSGMKALAHRSRQSYIRELEKFIAWCRRHDLLANNPLELAQRQRRQPGDKTDRVHFSTDNLKAIFSAPLYTGCKDDEHGFSKPGGQRPRRGRFWLPLLGLFTGARAGELCQLRTQDIGTSVGGTAFIRIQKEEEWMSGKTPSAERTIPIHPELIKVGFFGFVEAKRKTGEVFLFPEMLVDGRKTSYRFSKLFRTFRKSLGLDRPGLDFHSFRHTAREALKRVEVLNNRGGDLDHQIDLIFGWAGGKEMRNRYARGAWPVDELVRLVEQIAYPGLDLSHLHRTGS